MQNSNDTRTPLTRRTIFSDYLNDVALELKSQSFKTALLISAVALSIGALISSVSISANAAHQIDADLAAATGRKVLVKFTEDTRLAFQQSDHDSPDKDNKPAQHFPVDAVKKVQKLDLVQTVGMSLNVSDGVIAPVERKLVNFSSGNILVRAATRDYFDAAGISVTGPTSLLDSDLPVAFLGRELAEILGIPETADLTGLSISIAQQQFSVAGFIDSTDSLNNAAVIPYRLGLTMVGSDITAQMTIKTKLGAGTQVARAVRYVILPNAPETLAASPIASAQSARDQVSMQMGRQTLWIGLFLVFLSMLLIANSMVVAVTARTAEIGIRRALGSSKAAVSVVFLFEGSLVGALGGLGGSAFSVFVILIVSWVSSWSAFISLFWILLGPFLGMFVGLLASTYPAWRAARISPAIAVRAD